MRTPVFDVKATVATLVLLAACGVSAQESESIKTYSNEFVVKLPGKTPDEVKHLAELHGYTYLAPVSQFFVYSSV